MSSVHTALQPWLTLARERERLCWSRKLNTRMRTGVGGASHSEMFCWSSRYSEAQPKHAIDDLRKSRGLHSVRAFGHGPVLATFPNTIWALSLPLLPLWHSSLNKDLPEWQRAKYVDTTLESRWHNSFDKVIPNHHKFYCYKLLSRSRSPTPYLQHPGWTKANNALLLTNCISTLIQCLFLLNKVVLSLLANTWNGAINYSSLNLSRHARSWSQSLSFTALTAPCLAHKTANTSCQLPLVG